MNPAVFHIYAVRALRLSPETIRKIVTRIPAEKIDAQLAPERFTVREVIAHMADWEPVWLERLKTAVLNPGATIEARDEDQMAIDGKYSESDLEEQLKSFAKRRAEALALIESLEPSQLSHSVQHTQLGTISVMELVYLVMGHDAYHVEQLSQYLP